MYAHVQCAWTHEWPGQYLDVPGVSVEEEVVAVPDQGPAHPVPRGVTCSLSLDFLEWTGPPQPGRLWVNPPRSLRNWYHPLPLVSAWSAVDYSQRAAATLPSLDQLSAAWWSATGCALLSIQPTKTAQKLTVPLDFRSTAGCVPASHFAGPLDPYFSLIMQFQTPFGLQIPNKKSFTYSLPVLV